jgi:hypothetical protein
MFDKNLSLVLQKVLEKIPEVVRVCPDPQGVGKVKPYLTQPGPVAIKMLQSR